MGWHEKIISLVALSDFDACADSNWNDDGIHEHLLPTYCTCLMSLAKHNSDFVDDFVNPCGDFLTLSRISTIFTK